MSTLSAKARKNLPTSAFALPGGRYPIHDKRHAVAALVRVAQHGSPHEQAKVRAAVARRYPALPSSKARKPKADKVMSVEIIGVGGGGGGKADVELGSYGSKWRHGWIPLNAAATSLKLKQLRAGGKSQRVNGHEIHVAPNHHGSHSALIVHPDGTSHYVEHASSRGALLTAQRHPSVATPDKYAAARETLARRKREGTTPDQIAQEVRLGPDLARAEEKARQAHSDWVHEQERKNTANANKTTSEGVDKVTTTDPVLRRLSGSKANFDALAAERKKAADRTAFGLSGDAAEIAKAQYVLRQSEINSENPPSAAERDAARETLRRLGASRRTNVTKVKDGPRFSKQEMMLPGVRGSNDYPQTIVRPSMKMHRAGHKFADAGGPSPMVEHDQFAVEHINGAHLGHIDTNGGLHITGPGLERHKVGNVKEAIAGLHANYSIREREAQKAKAEAEKASTKTYREQQMERAQLIGQISSSAATRRQIENEVLSGGGTHEEQMARLKVKFAAKRAADLKAAQNERARQDTARTRHFDMVPPKGANTKTDTPRMAGQRAELSRVTERAPLALEEGMNAEHVAATVREGMAVTHGGRAGHVTAVYGQTFDSYHPPTEGQNGFYMRHEIRTRRGSKYLQSTFAGHSAAKAG